MNRPARQDRQDDGAAARNLAARIAGSHVHPRSLLATDYLNHFNEVAMILDMVGDMPDMLEEAVEWEPRSYVEHFAASNLKDSALAIEAFEHVPPDIRARFDALVAELDRDIPAGIARLAGLADHPEDFNRVAAELSERIQSRLAALNGVIHAAPGTVARAEGDTADQAEIDALFD